MNSLKLIDKDKIRLIQGSGVDTDVFFPCPHNDKTPLVILPARMLWDKGVGDFIVCAKYCVMNGINVKFILVGGLDIHNPECVPKKQLEEWVGAGIVEWWGKRKDMSKVYNSSSIVCFPSYHEGLPKSLLEAASCELPIIAYNVPGCREVVEDGENGILVTLKDKKALLSAVLLLLNDKVLRYNMGKNGRKKVLKRFTQEIIFEKTMATWSEF